MLNKKTKYFISLLALSIFLLASKTYAATITLVPDRQAAGVGDTVTVSLIIDSQGVNINSAQGIVNFSPETIQLTSVDRNTSIFNFWVEDPNFSNVTGKMSFIGGTTQGVSGNSLEVLNMKFKVTGVGKATISFSDGSVASNDGLGTNVLTKTVATSFDISGVSTSVPAASTAAVVVPQKIERKPVPTGKLPVAPTVDVNLYPDETAWYNHLGEVVVFWNVPVDVTAIGASIDQNPNGVPASFEKELFNGKNFGILKEGVWYAHVRFKNNVGVGPVFTHKISIDVTPPLSFQITSSDSGQSDNPSPVLEFHGSDSFSGIDYYSLSIDDQQTIRNDKGFLKLDPQEPGSHSIKITAYDKAGNTSEAYLDIKILPIASPKIEFITQPLYSDSDNVFQVSGSTLPNKSVLLSINKQDGGLSVANGMATVDSNGRFDYGFTQSLQNGSYKVMVRTQDSRKALSEWVSKDFKVSSKPVFVLGFVNLTLTGVIIFLLAVLAGGFIAGYLYFKMKQEKISRRIIITQRDVSKIVDSVKGDLKGLKRAIKTPGTFDDEELINHIDETIDKMDKYVKKEVGDVAK
ncbi:MAG: hypothetical protein PHN74_02745 [Candidatus Pacebacteria bacterium]|nr:hypothetical protein [Candidatus Paceibacterota bacterium]